MSYERTRIWLQGAALAIAAIAVMGTASHWAIEKLVAAELAPLQERVLKLEGAAERAAKAAEENSAGIAANSEGIAENGKGIAENGKGIAANSEALQWIKAKLQGQ